MQGNFVGIGLTKPSGKEPEVITYPALPVPRTISDTVRILGLELPKDATCDHAPSYYLGEDAFDDSFDGLRRLLGPNWPAARKKTGDSQVGAEGDEGSQSGAGVEGDEGVAGASSPADATNPAAAKPSMSSDEVLEKRHASFLRIYRDQALGEYSYNPTNMAVLFADWLLFARPVGWCVTDYLFFAGYAKSPAERRSFVNFGYLAHMRKVCGFSIDRNVARALTDKEEFLTVFADFVRRDWVYPQHATFQRFAEFVGKHPSFFAKRIKGLQGKGAFVVRDFDGDIVELRALYNRLRREGVICEELVVQHDDMAALCPDTVNTIRVVTLLDPQGAAHVLCASVRTGRLGACVDNYHGGHGYNATVDVATGRIASYGETGDHRLVEQHEDTGTVFPGHQIPCWEKVLDTACRAAESLPEVRYIGWDIAVRHDGEIVIIEGNSRPGTALMQRADQVGKRAAYQEIVGMWEEAANAKPWKKRERKLSDYVVPE